MEAAGLSGSSQEGHAFAVELSAMQKALENHHHMAAELADQLAALSAKARLLSAKATQRPSPVDCNSFGPIPPPKELKPQVRQVLDREEELDVQSREPMTPAGLFAGTDDLKAQIRMNLRDEPYSVHNFYKKTGWFQHIARSRRFEASSLLLVIASSFWMTVDIDTNDAMFLHEADAGYQAVAHAICFLFTLELIIRFGAFENIRNVVKDFWCMFDLLLVFFLVLETWVLWFLIGVLSIQMSASNVRVFSVLRMMRLVRVLRLVKLFRFLPEVLVIVKGIGVAMRPISLVFILLFMVIYVGAIIFRVLLEGTGFGDERFSTVMQAMATLLLDCAITGTRGGPLMKEAYLQHPAYSILIFIFMLLTNVTMMGLLVGLLVQTIKKVAEVEELEKKEDKNKQNMTDFWEHVRASDGDNDGYISIHEFYKLLGQRKTARLLKKMDVDPERLILLSDFVFDESDGRLSQEDFNQWVLDMRATQRGTIKDHIETRKFFTGKMKHFLQEHANEETIRGI